MIQSLVVANYLGETLVIELRNPEKSGFLVRYIDGLGPGKADVNFTEMSSGDGSVYNSARLPTRNIVIGLGFRFQPSIEYMRHMSYKYFPIKKKVQLLIQTDDRACFTEGIVESNEPDIFSKESTTVISIKCSDPFFYSSETNLSLFTGSTPLFEFEFFNDSLTEKTLEFGSVTNFTSNTVVYDGDADVGVLITLNSTGVAVNVTILNMTTGESMKIDTTKLEQLTGSGIIDGDEITISTVRGNKYIQLLRNGVYTNILNSLDKDADWIRLIRGDNVIAYTADSGIESLQFKIENQIVYEGV